jgi:LuxR family maltose regulon positive regulatory protein
MASPVPTIQGVTLSRTMPPALPPHFLTRSHLFPLIDNSVSGSTLVIAPAGYGKSSLVAEWAQQSARKVIWLTISGSDALQDMSSLFVQATRNVIPGFGKWFEENQPMRPSDVVRMWSNELLALGGEYVFVLDNLRDESKGDVEIEQKLIEQFPNNVHFIAIRRTHSQELLDLLGSRGPLKVLGTSELRFTPEEIAKLASVIGVNLTQSKNLAAVQSVQGWPSAASLILSQIEVDPDLDFDRIMQNQDGPLPALGRVALAKLDEKSRGTLTQLSIVEEFSLTLAREILGERFDYSIITALANQGEIISVTSNPDLTYTFSPLMRSILLEDLRRMDARKIELHVILSRYFQRVGRADLAMDHAFEAGDQNTVSALFRDASRVKHAQGKGNDLIRWAIYAGHSPVDGTFKRETMEIVGLLANLDFDAAHAKIEKLRVTLTKADDPEFFAQFTEASAAFLHHSISDFDSFDRSFQRVFESGGEIRLGVDEQLMLLRLAAGKEFILENTSGLDKIEARANELASQSTSEITHSYIGAISAMALFQRGEYRQSYDVASMTLRQFQRNGIVGLLGPVDVHFVMARCLLEFSRRDEAFQHFERTLSLGRTWRLLNWHVMADGYFARDIAMNNRFADALQRLANTRNVVKMSKDEGNLQQLIDLSEMFIRHRMGDLERLEILVARGLDIRYVYQWRLILDQFKKKKDLPEKVKELPGRNPRELIWKHLADAMEAGETESVALVEMAKALKIGAEVGARETFLRQEASLGNLIIRIATENPTVYNEDLSRAIRERIKEREMVKAEAGQSLTKRELEILNHLATGRTLTLIAQDLHISQNTMKTHLKNLYKKLEAKDRNDAIEKAKSLLLI